MKSKLCMRNKFFSVGMIILLMLFIIACGGGGGSDTGSGSTTTITGNVSKGRVSGSTVNIFILKADGSKGNSLGSTTTDQYGDFTFTFATPTNPLLVQASGGSYVNEVSGATDTLLSTDILTAVLPVGTTQAAITPLTHMAATRASILAANGISLATAIDVSNVGVAQQYNLSDIVGILPVDANNATQIEVSSREQRNYGLVLAGITQEAKNLNVRPIDLAAALAKDMDDGTLDGLGANPIKVPTITGAVINLPPDAGTVALQNAINTFLASGNNLTNLGGMNISTTPVNINPLGTTFYINYTALPAATEGRGYSAQLSATGGKTPYTWSVTKGSALPSWLTLNSHGTLSGQAPILSGGSTMSITPPFSLTCTDANGLAQAIKLTVTIVKAPPTTIPVQGICEAGKQFSTLVARAVGGVPPYHFRSPSFMNGSPPLGTSVWLDGTLRGICPDNAGTYNFPVCAVDLIGADPCAGTSLLVFVCTYAISPTGQSFNRTGGTGSVSVTPSSSSCNWTATSNASWITITSGSNVTGNGTVAFTVAANTGTSQRTGTMTIAGQTFTVTQAGTTTCTYAILPTSQSFNSTGGTGSVSVTPSSISCNWTATSNAGWITITSGSSATGNGIVAFTVVPNTGTSQRTGTMTIAGQTFTVTQSPPSPSSPLLGTKWLLWSGNGPWTGYSVGLIDFYLTIDSNGSLSASEAQCDLYGWCGSGTFTVSGTVSGNTISNFSITAHGSETSYACTISYSFSVTGILTTPDGVNMTHSGNATDSYHYSATCGGKDGSGSCAGNCLIGDIKQ